MSHYLATLPPGSGTSRPDFNTGTSKDDSNTTSPGSNPNSNPSQCISSILPVNLNDSPASGRGRYATVGALEPAIRIERSAVDSSNKASYRIIASFVLEVAIVGFDQSFQKHNRFFDSISLRYLFCRGDLIHTLPQSDAAVHGLQVTRERDKSSSVDAGVAPGYVSVAAPQFSVQAQRNFKLAYQRTMNSWRMGLSFVEYPPREAPPPLSSRFAGFLVPKSQQLLPRTKENLLDQPPQELQQPSFQVDSVHAPNCDCSYKFQHSSQSCSRWYDRATLWSWQTEAALRLWTPEIYGAFRCPITVMREVPVDIIDALTGGDSQALAPYLHFDFEVDVHLRVLGLGLVTLLTDAFRRTTSKPAEIRLQSDTGQSLAPDHIQFCVSCCPENISWPLYPTRNLQEEAELGTFGPSHVAHRLQTNREFGASIHKAKTVNRTASNVSPRYDGDPLALPAIVPVSWAEQPLQRNPLDRMVSGVSRPCRCQSLRSDQNRLYHCCIDCQYGHAFNTVRREPLMANSAYVPPALRLSALPATQTPPAYDVASPKPSLVTLTPAASRKSPTDSPRPQFRKRTSMEEILHQEKRRK